jgi:hypothetical protein
VVGIPESLEGLLTDLCVGSCVHQKHAEKHDMSSNTTSFRVVDLDGCDLSDLGFLDIEEAEDVSLLVMEDKTGSTYLT